jgi:serine protease
MTPTLFPRSAIALVYLGLVCGAALAQPSSAPAAGLPAAAYYTDQMIVKFKPQSGAAMSAQQKLALSTRMGIRFSAQRAMSGSAHVYRMAAGATHVDQVREAARQLMAENPDIEYAEPDYRKFPTAAFVGTPNDPQYTNMWNLKDPASQTASPWGGPQGGGGANLPGAWAITTGDPSVVVAVLDTGILAGHEDLAGRTVPGYDFLTSAVTANDGDGRDADPADPGDCASAVFCSSGSSSFHGTHVAGTIGAASNNGKGVTGVNWASKLQALRVLGVGGGPDSDIADAIRWGAGLPTSDGVTPWPQGPNPTPARVLNLSLGGYHSCGITLQAAIDAAVGNGAVVVVAAGNADGGLTAVPFSPATCANVITVAALAPDGSRASYSNYDDGATKYVTIAAPGGSGLSPFGADGRILSAGDFGSTAPLNDNAYVGYVGTSMAAPHVAGVVSLMLSVNPSLTPAQVKTILTSSARPFTSYWGPTWNCTTARCGAGMLDAAAAVQMAQGGVAPTLVSSVPADGATNVAVEANLVLNFSGAVVPGAAGQTIVLKRAADDSVVESFTSNGSVFIGSAGGTATITGSVLTLNPQPNLDISTGYYLQIDAAAIKGLTGLAYAGIADATTLNFTTSAVADVTVPKLVSSIPVNGTNMVPVTSDITLTFSESIRVGDAGQTIVLEKNGSGVALETFTSNGAAFTGSAGGTVTINGTVLTINPNPDMAAATMYFLRMGPTAIRDMAGNAYAGMNNFATSLGFATVSPDVTAPTLTLSAPADGATDVPLGANIALRFSKTMAVGSAGQTIALLKSADDSVVETFTSNGSVFTGSAGGAVFVNGREVTINPGADLQYSTGYYLQIGATAIKDAAGNPYAGIADKTTLNFTATAVPDVTVPTLRSSTPADNAGNVAVNANIVLTFSKSMARGDSGAEIVLRKADGTVVETFTSNGYVFVASAGGRVSIGGNVVTINPGVDLLVGTGYYLQIGAFALADESYNYFAGISDATTLNFTTLGAPVADTTPDAFSFTAQTGAALSAVVTSNTITVAGINAPSTISIAGGAYSVNGGAYMAAAGTVNNGDTVTVRQTASGSNSTTTTATLTIGGVNGAFSVTTVAAPVGRSYSAASPGGGGAITASFTGGGAGCGFASSSFVAATPPAGVSLPHGVFNFTTTDCGAGATLNFTITYPQALPAGTKYYKFGPEFGGSAVPHWYVLPGAVVSGNQITFSITDNAQGDSNPAVGFITDPGGPGAPGAAGGGVSSVPTLSEWGMLLLSLLLVGGAVHGRRRMGEFEKL